MDKNLLNEKLTLIPQNLLKRMLSVIFSCDHVLSHIIQQNLAAEIE